MNLFLAHYDNADFGIRVCLNFVFKGKNDGFFVLMKHIFKGIAKAIAAKIAKISA